MDLKSYLDAADETQADFAARVKTTAGTISRIVAGTMRPGLDLAHDIESATGGKVEMTQWVRERTPSHRNAA